MHQNNTNDCPVCAAGPTVLTGGRKAPQRNGLRLPLATFDVTPGERIYMGTFSSLTFKKSK
jgi:hypothetical protein